MATEPQTAGCRSAALAGGLLIALAVAFMAVGLSLINQSGCEGGCETLGLTLLYAGLPISAAFGVAFGELVLAWPLDITLWVVIGFLLARYADNRGRSASGGAIIAIAIALIYGLVLSQFVEIAI